MQNQEWVFWIVITIRRNASTAAKVEGTKIREGWGFFFFQKSRNIKQLVFDIDQELSFLDCVTAFDLHRTNYLTVPCAVAVYMLNSIGVFLQHICWESYTPCPCKPCKPQDNLARVECLYRRIFHNTTCRYKRQAVPSAISAHSSSILLNQESHHFRTKWPKS